ncbi:elongator complex protein 5 isoform X4 [Nycticebus coucang]|uniref:elongator complex protein 5 isoform X4 n=1 Tax=Nycticebus coucang TaxID=9470 RepID=UPI00234C36FF|nr:elongator complex protein 5 isoform X4 [Nycticebus coucang]
MLGLSGGRNQCPTPFAGGGGLWAMTPSGSARGVTRRKSDMLDSLLAFRGLTLLRDSVEWEGRSLLKALIKKSALCGEQVHILGCEVSEEEFREGFDSDINNCLVYHDLFRDPLNWSKTGEALPGGPLGALTAMCRRTDPGPVTIALDSLSWLLLHLPCTTLCQNLRALSHQNSCPGDSCSVRQTNWFSILPDFSLDLQEGPPVESQPHPDPHTSAVDPMTHLTFNLRLSKKEREAKDSLTLPFQFSSEKQQALLHPGPGQATSHIFYEPDVYDDLDQEDPDDDLDI